MSEPSAGDASAMQSPMVSRQDEIIELRMTGLTYAEIGRRFGITRERVRQILTPKPSKPKSEKPALQSKLMLTIAEPIEVAHRGSGKGGFCSIPICLSALSRNFSKHGLSCLRSSSDREDISWRMHFISLD